MNKPFLMLSRILNPWYQPTITKLSVDITDHCNSHCMNCNIWRHEGTPNEKMLTPAELEKILSDPIFKDVDYMLTSGGECTTRDDLLEIMRAQHRALPKSTLQISTNGLLPDKVISIVDTLLSEDSKTKIEIGTSLDGIGADHDAVRGTKGNYEKVIKLIQGVKRLREVYGRDRIDIAFGTVITDRTIDHIHELRDFADKEDIRILLQWYNTSTFYANERRDPGDPEKVKAVVKDADYTIISRKWCDWLDGKPIGFNCMALRSFAVIKCNGDIAPCLSLWDEVAGNAREQTPTEILTGKKWKEICDTKIKSCEGCLNSWGTYWSYESDPIQYLKYFIWHPIELVRKLCA